MSLDFNFLSNLKEPKEHHKQYFLNLRKIFIVCESFPHVQK